MNDREFYDLVKRFSKYSTNEKMTLQQYKLMMGVLGDTFLTERMFHAMDKDKDHLIDLEEYLTYNDVISNGTTREKREQNFTMLNDDKDNFVTYEEFEGFVIQILDMYSRTVSEKINANKEMIRDIFDQIATKGKNQFSFEEYLKALEKNPNLFIWLERPKEMLNDILNEQEGHYSRQFVDDTLDLLFRYIATTEYAMKKIVTHLRKYKEGRGTDNKDDDEQTLDLDDILTDIEEAPEDPDNLLLDLKGRQKDKVRSIFSRKQGYTDILKMLTGELKPSKSRSGSPVKGKVDMRNKSKSVMNKNEERKNTATTKHRKSSSSDYDGGNSESEDEASQGESDGSETDEESYSNRGSLAELIGKNNRQGIFSKFKNKSSGNHIDDVENICKVVLECTRSLDIEVQKKISNEINHGKVAIKGKRHLKDSEIKKHTNFRKEKASKNQVDNNKESDDELPEDREFIDFGHENFDLVFNIMLGIKRSID